MVLLSAFAALSIAAAPAPTVGPPRGSQEYDIQCMLVVNQVFPKVDAATKPKLGQLAMYYFGRVDSKIAGSPLQQRMGQVARRMTGRPLMPMLKDCGDFMAQRGAAMQHMGQTVNAQVKGQPSK